ncbi:MerR family transcriptional regulator [Staphylococcus gallinarum]|uniref:MerR family transcriptional regulator n=2 Tax=Staphylococcus gallinarum TaxID=1293 RepID=UPI000D1C3499|nr:MerR family transcriptional regulator [Staphylococcus gallinarum]MBU7216854.1 MerR family transcriptional regulator [Staphylococcus gallinarum]MCD8793779.1 MerR family transcriptional regulator [Staphylococcus gallinarum]MCD8828005.1 MerR family transcriptional regulator [Staphylococcus gallinarum]MCD8842813.1 MerR family transcriptional regulator [Staphylococcus gallinarum]MDN6412898.1 MerR family transcriptional regulator [Staphylococcus gallinarum]
MAYTIKEASEKMKIPAHTIRYYEKEGLLPFLKRNENGYRLFDEKDLGWLDFISCLKITGMPLEDLRKIITLTINEEENFDSRRKVLIDHKKDLFKQQEQLNKAFEKVDVKLEYFNQLEKEYKNRKK